jgi:hypothetical protein
MLLSTLIGTGGDAPLDTHLDWRGCSSQHSLGLVAMLLSTLIKTGTMLLLLIITGVMLLLKNPPRRLVCFILLVEPASSAVFKTDSASPKFG